MDSSRCAAPLEYSPSAETRGLHISPEELTSRDSAQSNSSSRASEGTRCESGTLPLAKVLSILQSLLKGAKVDLVAVEWLWVRLTSGEAVLEAPGSTQTLLKPALQGLERDVGASLAALLGPARVRRGSTTSDVDSTISSLLPRSSRVSRRSSAEWLQAMEGSHDSDCDGGYEEAHVSPIPAFPTPALEEALQAANTWGFDAFRFFEATDGQPLAMLGFWLLQKQGIIQDLGLDPRRLANYLREIDKRYAGPSKVPYHNKVHAADVIQQMHMLLTAGGLAAESSKRDPLTELACYMAAAVHDVDHQGVTNDYLTRTEHRLALLYNDASPHENHHAATAFQLIQQPDLNFLITMPQERKARLRSMVISMVLATDMKQHLAILSSFRSRLDSLSAVRQQVIGGCMRSSMSNSSAAGTHLLGAGGDSGRQLVLQVALKCADLGHVAAPWPIHWQWVKRLEEEMFLQGDKEAAASMSVSALMNRRRDGVSKSQIGFLERVALPLMRSWAAAFPGAHPMVVQAEANLTSWRALRQEQGPQP